MKILVVTLIMLGSFSAFAEVGMKYETACDTRCQLSTAKMSLVWSRLIVGVKLRYALSVYNSSCDIRVFQSERTAFRLVHVDEATCKARPSHVAAKNAADSYTSQLATLNQQMSEIDAKLALMK